jgi:ankyrin repeat protein
MSKEDLFTAIAEADYESVDTLTRPTFLNRTRKLHQADSGGYPAFFRALEKGQFKIADLFIARGYDVDSLSAGVVSPLMWAAKNGFTEAIRYLLKNGAEVNLKTPCGATALFWAVWRGEIDTVKLLLSHSAQVDYSCKDWWTPLQWAAMVGSHDMAALLIESSPNISTTSDVDNAPIFLALKFGQTRVAALMANAGMDAHLTTSAGESVLILALRTGMEDLALSLIKHGADVNVIDRRGNTALIYALDGALLAAAQALLDAGADAAVRNKDGESAFLVAAACGRRFQLERLVSQFPEGLLDVGGPLFEDSYLSLMTQLHRKGAAIDERTRVRGASALLYATFGNARKIAKYLLDKGAAADAGFGGERLWLTPLMGAAWRGAREIVEAMIAKQVNMEAAGAGVSAGLNCMHCAILGGSRDVVDLLRANHFELRNSTWNRETCSYLVPAVCSGSVEIAGILLDAGLDVNFHSTPIQPYSPLELAALKGNAEMLNYLISKGATVSRRSFNYAVAGGSMGILETYLSRPGYMTDDCLTWVTANPVEVTTLLIKAGANVNSRDFNQTTPLMVAARSNCIDWVEQLLANGAVESDVTRHLDCHADTQLVYRGADAVDYLSCAMDSGARELLLHLLPREYVQKNADRVFAYAIEKGWIEIVARQLEVDEKQRVPDDALAVALCWGHEAIAELLYARGVRVSMEFVYRPGMYGNFKGLMKAVNGEALHRNYAGPMADMKAGMLRNTQLMTSFAS